jgi:hypothetical protein
MTTPRRIFLMSVATTCIGLSYPAVAQAPKPVDEKDPQAVSLGYVAEAKRADAKKYPKFEASQTAPIARSTKARQVRRQVAVRCLRAAKLPAKAGAAPGIKKQAKLLSIPLSSKPASFKGNKATLPCKLCVACGLEMVWRKRWAKNWNEVKFCSDACRKNKKSHG